MARNVSRRTVIKGAAWAVPAISFAAASPAAAASVTISQSLPASADLFYPKLKDGSGNQRVTIYSSKPGNVVPASDHPEYYSISDAPVGTTTSGLVTLTFTVQGTVGLTSLFKTASYAGSTADYLDSGFYKKLVSSGANNSSTFSRVIIDSATTPDSDWVVSSVSSNEIILTNVGFAISSGSGSIKLPLVRWVNSDTTDTSTGFTLSVISVNSGLGAVSTGGTW